jgi:hypothetical protein
MKLPVQLFSKQGKPLALCTHIMRKTGPTEATDDTAYEYPPKITIAVNLTVHHLK